MRLTGIVRAPMPVRIGTGIDSAHPDLEAGLTFGFAEAARTAALFGWKIQRVTLVASDMARAEVHAMVLSHSVRSAPTSVPVLNLGCVDRSPSKNVFSLAACDAIDPDRESSPERRIVLWHQTLERFGAGQLNARYLGATGRPMTSGAWLGWFSIKLLLEAAMRARSTEPAALLAYLRRPTTQFDGHKGAPLRFNQQGGLDQPLYVIRRDSVSREWSVEREIK